MKASVCQSVDSKGNCVNLNINNLNSANFPPKNLCEGKELNGCHPWTVGWNGHFPMNYNDWLSSNNPVGWKRPDAYGKNMQYVPPQASCNNNSSLNKAPSYYYTPEYKNYSTLGNYLNIEPFNTNLLPIPSPTIKEHYIRPFNLNCTPQKPCIEEI